MRIKNFVKKFKVTILNTNNLLTVIWFEVFISNTKNFQTDLFSPLSGS